MRPKELRQGLNFSSALPPSILKYIYASSGILKLVIYVGKSQVWFHLYKYGKHKSIKDLVQWMLL